jgi:hypothetical protein
VLRLWRDRLSLFIAPDRIVMVRSRGMLRPKVVAKNIITVPGMASEMNWQAAIETLANIMQSDLDWQSSIVDVVLSNHFVRYQLIPWSAEISSADERAAYVHESFAQVYGDAMAHWVFSVSTTASGAAWFAGAMDRALLAQLESMVDQAKSQLRSVRPHLMSAFNLARRSIQGKNLWFVQIEKNKLLLGLINNGRWQSVSSHQLSDVQWQSQLLILLEREWRLNGVGNMPCLVVVSAPEMQPIVLGKMGKLEVVWLPTPVFREFAASEGASYAMAMGA